MAEVYLLIGGNQGNSRKILASANRALQEAGCTILKKSSIYRTEAWGLADQPDYLNQAIRLSCDLDPIPLLNLTQSIEFKYGRERKEKWGPRTLDIDILFYDDMIIDSARLTIPHPRLHERNFVLEPMQEIAPELRHPILGKTIAELYLDSLDSKNVYLLEEE